MLEGFTPKALHAPLHELPHNEFIETANRIATALGLPVKDGPTSLKTLTAKVPKTPEETRSLLESFGTNPKAVDLITNAMRGDVASVNIMKPFGGVPSPDLLWTMNCTSFGNGICGCEITWKGGGMSFPCA